MEGNNEWYKNEKRKEGKINNKNRKGVYRNAR